MNYHEKGHRPYVTGPLTAGNVNMVFFSCDLQLIKILFLKFQGEKTVMHRKLVSNKQGTGHRTAALHSRLDDSIVKPKTKLYFLSKEIAGFQEHLQSVLRAIIRQGYKIKRCIK